MRIRAAADGEVEARALLDVVEEAGGAAQEAIVLLALHAGAEPGELIHRASARRLAQVALDGLNDVLVARAPAEVAGQLVAQRRALERDAAIGERDGAEQEARGAVSALERVRVAERLLDGVQVASAREALDSRDATGPAPGARA